MPAWEQNGNTVGKGVVVVGKGNRYSMHTGRNQSQASTPYHHKRHRNRAVPAEKGRRGGKYAGGRKAGMHGGKGRQGREGQAGRGRARWGRGKGRGRGRGLAK